MPILQSELMKKENTYQGFQHSGEIITPVGSIVVSD
jgi:hypothetical protein